MARLGDVCEILDSKRIPITASDRIPGPYPYYGANGIQDYVADYIFDDELILLAEDGGNFGSKDKPIAYRVSGKCWVNNHAHVLKPKAGYDIDYVCYSLMYYDVTNLVNGATRQKLTQADMREMIIPERPLEEQKHIATLLGKLNDLTSLRKQQLAKLDELVKARFVEMFGDPEYNPQKLPAEKLCNLCEISSSKRIYQNEQCSNGVPFLRVSDLSNRIDKGIETYELFIPEEKYNELLSQKLVPVPGDILVTSRGTIGKCYIIKDEDRFYFQDGMISWLSNFNHEVTNLYIAYLFSTPYMQKQILSLQAGSTVAYLSISMLKKLEVLFPDLQSQQQFSDFLNRVNRFKLTIQQSLDKLEVLKKSLMQEYFGG